MTYVRGNITFTLPQNISQLFITWWDEVEREWVAQPINNSTEAREAVHLYHTKWAEAELAAEAKEEAE